MNTPKSDSIENTEGWRSIDWRKVEKYVFKLQKRIYAALVSVLVLFSLPSLPLQKRRLMLTKIR
ncbi:reverse transcriptase N-terminal domain-containing protein [Nostoc sp. NMS9]|uniref:reverse transcriptase N-terminal domain-containing protein n=1 Tax=Nostoc sp. NMS9 TaxID=2815393 RepID=UPI003457472D|nr:reverse transcriptase N-terminal domain-containing protein [Nostoc sp. NMS9]